MSAELARAHALQSDLSAEAVKLAGLISVPALERDMPSIEAQWQEIQALHAPLSTAYRKLRKSVRELGKGAQTRGLQASVKTLHQTLRLWEEIDCVVQRHIAPEEQDIDLDHVPQPHDAMVTYIYAALHILANPNEQHADALDRECFADIAMDIQRFEQLMSAAYRLLLVQGRTDTARFLDVGCGGGTKVLAAARYFSQCDGLEYDPGYAAAGQRTLDLIIPGKGQVFEGDALQFESYDAYDVIYYYRPIANLDLLYEMQERIVAQARPGTIILAPYNRYLEPRPPFPCAQIKGAVFVTGVTQDEADHWHANARLTDTDLLRRPRDLRNDPGVWTPVLDAASFNGSEWLDPKLLPEEKAYQVFSAAVT